MAVTEAQVAPLPCFDPECAAVGGVGEPEQDGEHRYFACTVCGNEFGWERVISETLALDPDGACSIGVPEDVRRVVSAPMEAAMRKAEQDEQRRTNQVPITIGRRPQ